MYTIEVLMSVHVHDKIKERETEQKTSTFWYDSEETFTAIIEGNEPNPNIDAYASPDYINEWAYDEVAEIEDADLIGVEVVDIKIFDTEAMAESYASERPSVSVDEAEDLMRRLSHSRDAREVDTII